MAFDYHLEVVHRDSAGNQKGPVRVFTGAHDEHFTLGPRRELRVEIEEIGLMDPNNTDQVKIRMTLREIA